MYQPQGQNQQKHDIFVGNLAFNTTEDQLHQAFSEIGRVLKVRMVIDSETGRSRGFAFVEFEDPHAALSAIRNMNEYELNGRRIRVNFSNSSHLEALAAKQGMEMPKPRSDSSNNQSSAGGQSVGAGTHAVSEALKNMNKGEIYDVVAKLKEIADRDPDEARRILSGHPQLPEAILHCMSKLEMIQTPLPGSAPPAMVPQQPPVVDPRQRMVDPRSRIDPRPSSVSAAPPPRADPRSRMDPRAQMSAVSNVPPQRPPPPPPPPQQYGMPPQQPPPSYPPPPPSGAGNLNPNLVQRVMSLTPQQIAELPADKQQSIMALRAQITGGR